MNTEKIAAVLNDVMVIKLISIATDIKYYINTNAAISQSLDEENMDAYKFMDDEEMSELIEIRKRIKQLAYKLKNKLNQ